MTIARMHNLSLTQNTVPGNCLGRYFLASSVFCYIAVCRTSFLTKQHLMRPHRSKMLDYALEKLTFLRCNMQRYFTTLVDKMTDY